MQGLGKRAGSLVEDQVCVQLPIRQVPGVCAPAVQFLSVSATKGAQGHEEDGVFGLSPAPITGGPPSFIDGLYKEGAIEELVATLSHTNLTLGGSDPDAIRGQWYTHSLIS